jgi:HSP20 family protein
MWEGQHTLRKGLEVFVMLMRTDPFRELDRFTQQLLGTNARPTAMPMDAWREGDHVVVEFDLPGVSPGSVDLDVERNVLTVTAQRTLLDQGAEFLAAERPRGVFSRQLVLGDNLDLDRIQAVYRDGVLRLHIPVAERAKPRKITISHDTGESDQAITARQDANGTSQQRNDASIDSRTVDA